MLDVLDVHRRSWVGMKEKGFLAIKPSLWIYPQTGRHLVEKTSFHLLTAVMIDAISALPELRMHDENSVS